MSNEELVMLIQNGQPGRIGDLWTQCERFVRKLANQWTGSAEFDDLVQQGFLILHDAAADYDPGQGVMFLNYLGQRLPWGWARWIAETGAAVRLPSYMVQRMREYKRICREYAAEHGCEPSEREIGRLMAVSPATVRLIRETALKAKIRSLNEHIQSDDGSGIELQDTLADDGDMTADVLDRVQQEQLAAVIWPMVDELEERQARVIWERYKQNMTLKGCARGMGVSLDRVRQIEQKALRNLRRTENTRKLQPFLDDVYSAAIRGTGLSQFRQSWTSATEREAMRNCEQQREVIQTQSQAAQDVERLLADLEQKLEALHRELEQFEHCIE